MFYCEVFQYETQKILRLHIKMTEKHKKPKCQSFYETKKEFILNKKYFCGFYILYVMITLKKGIIENTQ